MHNKCMYIFFVTFIFKYRYVKKIVKFLTGKQFSLTLIFYYKQIITNNYYTICDDTQHSDKHNYETIKNYTQYI